VIFHDRRKNGRVAHSCDSKPSETSPISDLVSYYTASTGGTPVLRMRVREGS
jgi:hypothetical protein